MFLVVPKNLLQKLCYNLFNDFLEILSFCENTNTQPLTELAILRTKNAIEALSQILVKTVAKYLRNTDQKLSGLKEKESTSESQTRIYFFPGVLCIMF